MGGFWRSLSRLERCNRVESVEVAGGFGLILELEGFKGEARHVKLARLVWNMWRLCAGKVELICIMCGE